MGCAYKHKRVSFVWLSITLRPIFLQKFDIRVILLLLFCHFLFPFYNKLENNFTEEQQSTFWGKLKTIIFDNDCLFFVSLFFNVKIIIVSHIVCSNVSYNEAWLTESVSNIDIKSISYRYVMNNRLIIFSKNNF